VIVMEPTLSLSKAAESLLSLANMIRDSTQNSWATPFQSTKVEASLSREPTLAPMAKASKKRSKSMKLSGCLPPTCLHVSTVKGRGHDSEESNGTRPQFLDPGKPFLC
jgi:hypothetical protein